MICAYLVCMPYLPRYQVICDDSVFHVTWQCHNKDWLLKDSPNPEVALSAKNWSTLSFFAHETIAEIVDLAFIVRRDNTVGHEVRKCES